MKQKLQKSLFLLFFFTSSFFVSSQEKLVFSTIEGVVPATFITAILKEAYLRLGIDIEIIELPGRRAIRSSNRGDTDGELFRIADIEDNYSNLIRIDVVLKMDNIFLFVREGEEFAIDGWEDIPKRRVIGYKQGLQFIENIIDEYDLSVIPSSTLNQQFFQFTNGRSDILVLGESEGLEYLQKSEFDNIVRLEPPIISNKLYHYLHKGNAHLVPQITEVLENMAVYGEIQEIIDRINISNYQ